MSMIDGFALRRGALLGAPPRGRKCVPRVTLASRGSWALMALVVWVVATCAVPSVMLAQPHSASAGALTSAQSRERARAAVLARLDTLAFPHGKHARLFPTCTSCHRNVGSTRIDDLFPPATACAECHNGTDAKRVTWERPARPAPQRLLAFSHARHFSKTDSAGRTCAVCHAVEGSTAYMNIRPARQPQCQGCHEHRTTDHYAPDNTCRTCHVPLTEARGLTVAEVARLPKPASHEVRGFEVAHGPTTPGALAQCATCHARETCARCHVNARTQPMIAQLASDGRVAQLVKGRPATYPVPDSHRAEAFVDSHGPLARAPQATCGTCHARPSCATCHIGRGAAEVINRLPAGQEPTPGVKLYRLTGRREGISRVTPMPLVPAVDTTRFRVRVHAVDFVENHRFSAAASRQTCQGCHTQRFCSDCHAGENRRAFHPLNFVTSHGADTYARDRECASCHNTEVFCRDCHKAVGLAAQGRNAAVYHNAQPQWLLQHGRAARQELQTCTTCHTQNNCMRCHATTGWGVSPHGPDFNASRLGKKAMAMCARCHIRDPRR